MSLDPTDNSVLYGRPRYLKVFISSKMTGDPLADERKAAIDGVEAFPLAEPWAWERDAIAGSFCSEAECVGQAETSDGLILILEDDLTPITRSEYEAAHRQGAHMIVLRKGGGKLPSELQRFIASTRRAGATTKEFSGIEELRSFIDEALWAWTVRAGRMLIVSARRKREDLGEAALLEQAELTGDDGKTRTLGEVIEEAEVTVEQGDAAAALDLLYEVAATATEEEHLPLARALLSELERVIPDGAVDEMMRGWIFNLKGRTCPNRDQADVYFEHMRQIGRAIDDKNLEATALQNLGVLAVMENQTESAKAFFNDSIALKLEIGDDYGATQVMLNVVNVMLSTRAFDAADELLGHLGKVLRGLQGLANLRSSLFGQKGMVETRRGNLVEAKAEFAKSLAQARRAQSAAREANALQSLGSNAREQGSNRDALRWYRKALERARALGDRRTEMQLLSAIGTVHGELDEWDLAASCFSNAADLADIVEDGDAQSQAWGNLAACWIRIGKSDVAERLIKQALNDPKANSDPVWRATQLKNLGEVLVGLAEPEAAMNRFEESANLSPEPEEKEAALQRAAEVALSSPGLAGRAPALLERALQVQLDQGKKADWAWQAATFGALLSDTSESSAAIDFFGKALAVFARSRDYRRAFYTRNDRAIARSQTDDLAGAAADLRAARRLAETFNDPRLQCQARMNLGEIERQRGRYSAAQKELCAALKIAQDIEDLPAKGSVLALTALLKVMEGDLDKAEDLYKEALAIGRAQRDPMIEASALGGLAGCAHRRGRFAEAEKRYQQAIRRRADSPTNLLAEDLAGLIMSQAVRGKADEVTLQQLVDVSGKIGWDSHAADQLSIAARTLAENGGDTGEAVSVQAASLMCAIRAAMIRTEKPFEPGNEGFDRVLRVTMEGVYWIRDLEDSDSQLQQLDEAVADCFDLPPGDSLVSDLIQQASEVWAEPRGALASTG